MTLTSSRLKTVLKDLPRVPLYMLYYSIYAASFLSLRSRRIWLFDEWQGMRFADNPRYVFLYIHEHQPHVKAIWISHSHALIAELRSQGLCAHHAYSSMGLWYTFRAKVIIFESTTSVFFWLTGGMTKVNLWHGIPIKKIVYDSARTKKENWVYTATGFRRWYHAFFDPAKIALGDYVLAQSPTWKQIFSSAFRLNPERILVENQPRNVALIAQDVFLLLGERRWTDEMEEKRKTQKIITYLPTFRDGLRDPLQESGIDFRVLDAVLARSGAHMYIKTHHEKTISGETEPHGHITFLPVELGVMPILRQSDILVTDYSSIFFEFLLTNRPIIFFPFDLDTYKGSLRDMYFEYDLITPGAKPRTFDALCQEIERTVRGEDGYADRRSAIRDIAFSPHPESAPEKVYDIVAQLIA